MRVHSTLKVFITQVAFCSRLFFLCLPSIQVLVGVLQRFGVVALTTRERKDILNTCIYSRPHVLEICVARLTEMQVRFDHHSACGRCRELPAHRIYLHLCSSSSTSSSGGCRRLAPKNANNKHPGSLMLEVKIPPLENLCCVRSLGYFFSVAQAIALLYVLL